MTSQSMILLDNNRSDIILVKLYWLAIIDFMRQDGGPCIYKRSWPTTGSVGYMAFDSGLNKHCFLFDSPDLQIGITQINKSKDEEKKIMIA